MHVKMKNLFVLEIFPLKCAVQNYAWGKVGEDSIVARLATCDNDFSLINDRTYAEVCIL